MQSLARLLRQLSGLFLMAESIQWIFGYKKENMMISGDWYDFWWCYGDVWHFHFYSNDRGCFATSLVEPVLSRSLPQNGARSLFIRRLSRGEYEALVPGEGYGRPLDGFLIKRIFNTIGRQRTAVNPKLVR